MKVKKRKAKKTPPKRAQKAGDGSAAAAETSQHADSAERGAPSLDEASVRARCNTLQMRLHSFVGCQLICH